MGLIDFIKNVGHKLDHGHDPAKPAAQPQAPQGPTAQQVQELNDKKREAALTNLVNQMGLKAQNLVLDVQGDRVIAKGTVNSQEDKEKLVLLLGNTEGIAHVDDQLTVSNPQPQAPQAQFYDVQPGDSLSKIAKHFYGDAHKWRHIFEANRDVIKDPDLIYPGQTIKIPSE